MARVIPLRQKYRWPGKWPKSQRSPGDNKGDKRRNKMPAQTAAQRAEKAAQVERSRAGMSMFVIRNGKKYKEKW